MEIANLDKLLEDQLKDLYSAEKQLAKALPKMARGATSKGLKQAFTAHLAETEQHAARLEQIGQMLAIKLTGKKCAAMEGLVKEGQEVLDMSGPETVIDTALIGAAQRVEHYEMAGYGTARAIAEHLGRTDVVKILQKTLDEEGATDKKLTAICQREVLKKNAEHKPEKQVKGETLTQKVVDFAGNLFTSDTAPKKASAAGKKAPAKKAAAKKAAPANKSSSTSQAGAAKRSTSSKSKAKSKSK